MERVLKNAALLFIRAKDPQGDHTCSSCARFCGACVAQPGRLVTSGSRIDPLVNITSAENGSLIDLTLGSRQKGVAPEDANFANRSDDKGKL